MTGRSTPRSRRVAVSAWCLVCAHTTAWADPVASIQQCRQLKDAALRVACYDAIALPVVVPLAVRPALTVTPATVISPPGVTPSVAVFGLPAVVTRPTPGAALAAVMESRITGGFDGWQATSKLRLANGQIWQISDDSEGTYSLREPKVRISRGSFGGFFMQIEGVTQTPRVRRVE